MFDRIFHVAIALMCFTFAMTTVFLIYKGTTYDDKAAIECIKAGKNWTLDGDWKHECQ